MFILWQISLGLPAIYKVDDYKPRRVSKVFAKKNKTENELIGEYFLEKRTLIPYSEIPESVVKAFIAAEDDTFFEHHGINFSAILRAALANLKAGQVVQGGSTITQQVAKTLFLTTERSILRKVREAILSKRLESYLKKEEILYLYLNQIYLGNGAYGVSEATQAFFRKEVKNITLAEAALLAGLTRAPSAFNPLHNPKRAKERQVYVLERMKAVGFISEDEMKKASEDQLKIFEMKKPVIDEAQFFVEHIRKELIAQYGEKTLYEEGLSIFTPVHYEYLKSSYEALRNGVKEIDQRKGYRGATKNIPPSEISAWSEENRKQMTRQQLGFKYLNSTGALIEPIEEFQLKINKSYTGIVSTINDKEKFALIQIGNQTIRIQKEGYEWAKPIQTNNKKPVRDPNVPSDVFKLNDVVLVQPTKLISAGNYFGRLDQEPLVEGALVSIDINTGQVLALQGGYDFNKSEFNRAFQAQRQVGSAMKPILYACAIENGKTVTTTLVDMPLSFETEEYGRWRPENYDNKFEGEIALRTAFAKSRNPPAVYLVGELGLNKVLKFAQRLGWKSPLNEDLSSALGSSSETLMNMTEIYSVFPRYGRKIKSIFIDKIVNNSGETLLLNEPDLVPSSIKTSLLKLKDLSGIEKTEEVVQGKENKTADESQTEESSSRDQLIELLSRSYPMEEDPNQVLDPRVAYVMNTLLREAVIFGTGSKASSLGKVVGGKTGTTNDYKDAWFIGFSPHIVTGVWVGYDDPSISLGEKETGGQAALPIWMNYMKDALTLYPDSEFVIPPGISFVPIHKDTSQVFKGSAKDSAQALNAAFIEGTEPSKNEGKLQSKPSGTRGEFLKQDFE